METLARATIRGRWLFVGLWLILTVAGADGDGKLADRWFEQFSIPGYSAYEANQRTLETFGTGRQYPLVAVFQVEDGDIRAQPGIEKAIAAGAAVNEGSRVSSWFETKEDTFVSPAITGRCSRSSIRPARRPSSRSCRSRRPAQRSPRAPAGVTTHLTGVDAIFQSQGGASGPSVLAETLLGGIGALLILLFVFGTLPAVLMPLARGDLVDPDHVPLRPRADVRHGRLDHRPVPRRARRARHRDRLLAADDLPLPGRDATVATTDEAIVETMQHAGRSVIVSGTTVAIGLVSMVILPLPFIRSIGLGGMLIPLVSVLASITLTPALLRLLGPKINRLRVMPKRLLTKDDAESGFWTRWAGIVSKRPLVIFLVGHGRRRPAPDSGLADEPERRRDGQATCDSRCRRGPAGARRRGHHAWRLQAVCRARRGNERSREARRDHGGGAQTPTAWRGDGTGGRRVAQGRTALLEAFSSTDASSRGEPQGDLEPAEERAARRRVRSGDGVTATLGGSLRRSATSSTPSTATSAGCCCS